MNKKNNNIFSDADIKSGVLNIVQKLYADDYRPDLIIGLARGGAMPAIMLSNFLDVPCQIYNRYGEITTTWYTKILVVDDINDTGISLRQVKETLLHYSGEVKYAVLVDNAASQFDVDYYGYEINKAIDDRWVIFPWENWWDDHNDH